MKKLSFLLISFLLISCYTEVGEGVIIEKRNELNMKSYKVVMINSDDTLFVDGIPRIFHKKRLGDTISIYSIYTAIGYKYSDHK